jgi:hypothetical protein
VSSARNSSLSRSKPERAGGGEGSRGIDTHTLMTSELLAFWDWHAKGDGSVSNLPKAGDLFGRERGAICEKLG